MRLFPKSLFGRLMLILIIGLILIQFISATLLLKDRHQFLQDRLGLQFIQRITAIVVLMETIQPDQRAVVLRTLNAPRFRLALSDNPLESNPDALPADNLAFWLSKQLPNHPEIIATREPFMPRMHDEWPDDEHDQRRGRDRFWMDKERHWMPPHMRERRGFIADALSGFQIQVRLSDGQWLSFSRPLPTEVESWPKKLLLVLLVVLFLLIAISLVAVRQLTKPLNTLAEAADELGRDIDRPPLPESGAKDVQKATRAFNNMQRRLQRFINDRSEIISAVSHDLKTPITRLRLRTEMLQDDKVKQQFEHDLDQMEQMVSATLDFMRGTESKEKTVPIDMVALVESVQDDLSELGWKVSVESTRIPAYTGRPLALQRCLSNLMENAARYGNEAIVSFQDTPKALTIIIADSGSGISENQHETLFKPFYRGEASRNLDEGGSGLGLGIARNIARAHGGELILRKGRERGLEAVLTLPR